MNDQIRFSHLVIILVTTIMLAACSDSPETAPPPPIVTQVAFPFIVNDALHEFDPKTGEDTLLVESNRFLMVTLDTDQSKSASDESRNSYLAHSTLPEFVAYVIDQELWLYDLNTRKKHMLFTFAATSEHINERYICDLQKVISVDINSFESKVELLKDEKAVFVKTSESENCDGTDFIYSRIIIADSRKDTFTIRRKTLLKHKHTQNHQHSHSVNDENMSNHDDIEQHLNNDPQAFMHKHEHVHEHIHAFGYEHEHGHAHGPGHEEEHNKPENIEIVTETLPVLVGKTRIAEEALMYAGAPIVDLDNQQFGYLGFEKSTDTYKFFLADIETLDEAELVKSEIWTLAHSDFLTRPEQQPSGNLDKLFPAITRATNHFRLANSLLIEHNWNIIKLNFKDFFDDDLDTEREFGVDNPVFQRSQESVYNPAFIRHNASTDILAVKDQNNIFIVNDVNNNSIPGTPQLVRTMDDNGLSSFEFELFSGHIVALKNRSGDLAITAIELDSSNEQTLLSSTSDDLKTKVITDLGLFISREDTDNNSWESNLRLGNLANQFQIPLAPAIWTTVYDGSTRMQINKQPSPYPAIIMKDSAEDSAAGSISPIITDPDLFRYDEATGSVEAASLGKVPSIVNSATDGAFIFHGHYGTLKIRQSEDANAPIQVFYFDPSEPDDMKLMYEEAIE